MIEQGVNTTVTCWNGIGIGIGIGMEWNGMGIGFGKCGEIVMGMGHVSLS